MARPKGPPSQRRVYVLPDELLQRVMDFAMEKGLASESEAVRRLLDEALRKRETYREIIERMVRRMSEVPTIAEAAQDVLAAHPLIRHLRYEEDDGVKFGLRDGMEIEIDGNRHVAIRDAEGSRVPWKNGLPSLDDQDLPF